MDGSGDCAFGDENHEESSDGGGILGGEVGGYGACDSTLYLLAGSSACMACFAGTYSDFTGAGYDVSCCRFYRSKSSLHGFRVVGLCGHGAFIYPIIFGRGVGDLESG
jgi:hypothetical protein